MTSKTNTEPTYVTLTDEELRMYCARARRLRAEAMRDMFLSLRRRTGDLLAARGSRRKASSTR